MCGNLSCVLAEVKMLIIEFLVLAKCQHKNYQKRKEEDNEGNNEGSYNVSWRLCHKRRACIGGASAYRINGCCVLHIPLLETVAGAQLRVI